MHKENLSIDTALDPCYVLLDSIFKLEATNLPIPRNKLAVLNRAYGVCSFISRLLTLLFSTDDMSVKLTSVVASC
jgi:hypothetical protein